MIAANGVRALAGLRTVLLNVGIIARQRLQHFRRHPPYPFRRGLHDPLTAAAINFKRLARNFANDLRKPGSHQTPRWSKRDSNRLSPKRGIS